MGDWFTASAGDMAKFNLPFSPAACPPVFGPLLSRRPPTRTKLFPWLSPSRHCTHASPTPQSGPVLRADGTRGAGRAGDYVAGICGGKRDSGGWRCIGCHAGNERRIKHRTGTECGCKSSLSLLHGGVPAGTNSRHHHRQHQIKKAAPPGGMPETYFLLKLVSFALVARYPPRTTTAPASVPPNISTITVDPLTANC
jgi:hypothetical protein